VTGNQNKRSFHRRKLFVNMALLDPLHGTWEKEICMSIVATTKNLKSVIVSITDVFFLEWDQGKKSEILILTSCTCFIPELLLQCMELASQH